MIAAVTEHTDDYVPAREIPISAPSNRAWEFIGTIARMTLPGRDSEDDAATLKSLIDMARTLQDLRGDADGR